MIAFSPAFWTDEIDTLAARVFPQRDTRDQIAAEVADGSATVFRFSGDSEGIVILTEIIDGLGRDLLVWGLVGDGEGIPASVDQFVSMVAQIGGYDGVRAVATRKGAQAVIERAGWQEVARTYRRKP